MAKLKRQSKKVKAVKKKTAVKKKPIAKKKAAKTKTTHATNATNPRMDKKGRSLNQRDLTTAKKKKLVLEGLQESFGIVTNAILKGKVDNGTFYRWYNADKKFKEAVDEIQDQIDIIVDDQIKMKLISGDGSMLRFYATKRMKKYKDKKQGGFEGDEEEVMKDFNLTISVKKTNDKKSE